MDTITRHDAATHSPPPPGGDRLTERLLDLFEKGLEKQVSSIEKMDTNVCARLDSLDTSMGRMDGRVGQMDERFGLMDERFGLLNERLAAIDVAARALQVLALGVCMLALVAVVGLGGRFSAAYGEASLSAAAAQAADTKKP